MEREERKGYGWKAEGGGGKKVGMEGEVHEEG